jgi:nucleotide-binding universal stress UspA family protein
VLRDQQRLSDAIGSTADGVTLKHVLGDPVPSILAEAKSIDADLIVLGAKGHTMLHRLLLGSTSDSVATLATCSVLVVRSKPDREDPMNDPPKLLIGYDGSAGSREAIAEQLSLNWNPKTEVHLVSVAAQAYAFFDDTYASMAAAYEDEQVERLRTDAEQMCGQIAKTLPNTNLQVPRVNHIGDAIVNAADGNDDDLIVVGDTGHNLIGELLLGSTTKYVLRHAGCSVWISRHHRRDDETG